MRNKKRPYWRPLIDMSIVELEDCFAAGSPTMIPTKESDLQPDLIEMEIEEVKNNLDY